jgi:hypothetical protein
MAPARVLGDRAVRVGCGLLLRSPLTRPAACSEFDVVGWVGWWLRAGGGEGEAVRLRGGAAVFLIPCWYYSVWYLEFVEDFKSMADVAARCGYGWMLVFMSRKLVRTRAGWMTERRNTLTDRQYTGVLQYTKTT